MMPKMKTIFAALCIVLVFVTFMGIFASLSIILMVVGLYWAFQLFWSTAWWAGLLVMLGLLAFYALALAIALEFIERKTHEWN